MTEKPRILPVDPMEVARRPIEGVDLPEEKDGAAARDVDGATRTGSKGQQQFVENEGLAGQTTREAVGTIGTRKPDELEEASEAALRGRTA